MNRPARHRGLLVALMLLLIGSGIPITLQATRAQEGEGTTRVASWLDGVSEGEFTPAFTEIIEFQEGTPGQVDIEEADTPENPAGGCFTDRSVSPAMMSITFDHPVIHAAGNTAQTIAVQELLYQYVPGSGGSFTLAFATDPDFYTVAPGAPVDPESIEVIDIPVGPMFRAVVGISWYDETSIPPVGQPSGYAAYEIDNYGVYYNGSYRETTDSCYPLVNPLASLSPTSGIVNRTVTFRIYYFPVDETFVATWDGRSLPTSTTTTNFLGRATGTFRVPDGQVKGDHTVTFTMGEWQATRLFTVTSRIKVTPGTVARGEEVKISLRGYNARETVRIRWRDSEGVWREIGRVTTSSTGSAQLFVPVPLFAPDGQNSVRGDAVISGGARAQTNAVTVTGGAFQTANAPATPEASSTATATPEGTPSPSATVTESPTVEPTVEPTLEPTVEPTIEPTVEPTVEPTTEPTVEPTIEPTVEPTVDATGEATVDAPASSDEGAGQ